MRAACFIDACSSGVHSCLRMYLTVCGRRIESMATLWLVCDNLTLNAMYYLQF